MSKEQNNLKSTQSGEQLKGTPSAQQREAAITRIVQAVSNWLKVRIDEVFEMADEGREPECGARITWRDLEEVRDQICVCVANDLEDDCNDQILEILRHELGRGDETLR